MLKYLFITLGSIFLGLGITGFILPILPGTPFMLLCAYFYAKSSPELYAKLENHKIIGCYLKQKRKLSTKGKLMSLTLMWVMILISTFGILGNSIKMQCVMLGLGIMGTIFQLFFFGRGEKSVKTASIEGNLDN